MTAGILLKCDEREYCCGVLDTRGKYLLFKFIVNDYSF
jgi:hypothetical protein